MLDLPTPASHALDPDSGLWVPVRRGLCSVSSGVAGAAAMQGARRSRVGGGPTYLIDWSTDITFTRASEAAAVDPRDGFAWYDLVTPWPGSNVARILDDAALLLEGPRTTLLGYSDPGSWPLSAGTPTVSSGATAPDGTSTASTIGDDFSGAFEAKRQTFLLASTGEHRLSIYVDKDADTSRFPEFQVQESTATISGGQLAVQINTSTGATTTRLGSPTFVAVIDEGSWWRLIIGLNCTATGTAQLYLYPAVTASWGAAQTSATGTTLAALAVIEAGGYALSPIRSSAGTTVTRSSERALIGSADVPAAVLTGAYALDVWPLYPSSDGGTHQVLYASSTRRLTLTGGTVTLVSDGGTDAVSSLTWSALDKLTIGVNPAGNLSVRINGGSASTTAQSGDWSDVSGDIDVGSDGAGAAHLDGVISRLRAA